QETTVSGDLLLALIVRWIHIISATIAIGAPFFVRFALLPAASSELDDATHQKLRAAINRRWAKIVYIVITLFILTGLYNFFVATRVNGELITARWRDFAPEDRKIYHMIFGFKMIFAFTLFFLASALAGRTNTFAPIRKNAKLFLVVLLLTAALIIVCSTL